MKIFVVFLFAFANVIISAGCLFAYAENHTGKTYEIIEKDSLSEIEEAAAKVDWDKALPQEEREKVVKNYKAPDLVHLPRSIENKVYNVDMTYSLEMDIPDANGRIVYPKGYKINPLDFIDYHNTLIIIDPTDPKQIEWVKKKGYDNDISAKIFITDGNYGEVAEKIDKNVYYLSEIIAKRLQLKAVPSTVKQNGQYMEVTQYNAETL